MQANPGSRSGRQEHKQNSRNLGPCGRLCGHPLWIGPRGLFTLSWVLSVMLVSSALLGSSRLGLSYRASHAQVDHRKLYFISSKHSPVIQTHPSVLNALPQQKQQPTRLKQRRSGSDGIRSLTTEQNRTENKQTSIELQCADPRAPMRCQERKIGPFENGESLKSWMKFVQERSLLGRTRRRLERNASDLQATSSQSKVPQLATWQRMALQGRSSNIDWA